MKLLHLSDLHIGKRVNGFSMIEDQKYILEQILEIARTQQTDGVLIAGDIYDKAVPSAEAVQVFDHFLTALAGEGQQVFAVSGNHDSAERIAFGAQLMQAKGVHLSPVYQGHMERLKLQDAYGALEIFLLPFLKPAIVNHALGEEAAQSYQEAVELALMQDQPDPQKRNILLAHQFVAGAGRCDSEELVVGGIDQVSADTFNAFDYVALGHIHSPQSVGRETLRYCGSPLKYSFSEIGQEKSVTVVELLEKGQVKLDTVPLCPLHDMRRIKGSYLEVTARSFYEGMDRQDYMQVVLTDEEDVPDGLEKLQIIYPNLMSLSYDNSRTRREQELEQPADAQKKTAEELFADFYEMQNNRPMSAEQAAFVKKLADGLRDRDGQNEVMSADAAEGRRV